MGSSIGLDVYFDETTMVHDTLQTGEMTIELYTKDIHIILNSRMKMANKHFASNFFPDKSTHWKKKSSLNKTKS